MQAAGAAREATKEVLVFILGAEEYGVDILKVQEIRELEKVTPVPAAPAYLKGIVNLRGVIVPVLDLRVKFAMAEARYDATTVMIVLRIAGRVIGIVVDSVSDVVRLAPSDIKAAPRLGAVVDGAYIAGLATPDGRMIMLVDIEKFLSGADLDLLERAAEGVPGTQ
jgi:purine-binding chemotaxis protein CheW